MKKKKNTERDTSAQTDSSADPLIFDADDVEMQHPFNKLRGELLDNRATYINYWLSAIAIVLTFFGIVIAVAGYIGFTRFQEIEAEAKNSAMNATKYAQKADSLAAEIKKHLDIAVGYLDSIKTVNAEIVASNLDKAKQIAAGVDENPRASPIDKAIAQAILLQAQERIGEAIEKWRAVAQIAEGIDNDQAARAWFSVGYLVEKPEDSISAYDEAIRLKPDYAEAYNDRGVAKSERGRYEEAIADYDEAIRLQPEDAEAYTNRGAVKIGLGRYKDAIADLDKAIRLQPDLIPAYNNRGNAKILSEQYDEAIADYDEAIRLQPDLAEAYYNRGVAKRALDRIDEARQDFEKARDLARKAGNDRIVGLAEQGLRVLDSQEDE